MNSVKAQSSKQSRMVPALMFLALAAVPILARYGSESYILSLMTRTVIIAAAAMSLDLLIGYAGMVSLGHAAFVGIGAYAVGILGAHGMTDGFIALAAAIVGGLIFAGLTGAIAIRSQGAYLIMITLAFGQMVFFVAIALASYGGDDGMTLQSRSTLFGRAVFDGDASLYYCSLAFLLLCYVVLSRIVQSHFGRILAGCRENPVQMQAIGFIPSRYRLVAYIIAGVIASVAGALLANQAGFVSPSTMAWQRSGDLIFMVVLGGAGSLYGAVIGAVVFLLAEEFLAQITEHWPIIFGPLLILSVFVARGGLVSLFSKGRAHD